MQSQIFKVWSLSWASKRNDFFADILEKNPLVSGWGGPLVAKDEDGRWYVNEQWRYCDGEFKYLQLDTNWLGSTAMAPYSVRLLTTWTHG